MYDADYRASKRDFDTFVESLTEKIIEKDETIPELPPKDLVRLHAHRSYCWSRAETEFSLLDISHIQRHTVQP